MQIESVLVGAFSVNCLLLWKDPARTLVIDPGAEPALIGNELNRRGLTVGAYWLTHGHIDHISALQEMLATHPAPVYMHQGDAGWAFTEVNKYPPYIRVPAKPEGLKFFEEGAAPDECGLGGEILYTPGHTPGCVCFLFDEDGLLITGDTLFQGSVGRTDLPGGDWSTLMTSLGKLLGMPDSLQVIPGHGPESTMGEEKRANPYLREAREMPS